MNFDVPILLLAFNRLDTTKRVLGVIQHVKPSRIFIAMDGPRDLVKDEKEKVESVKKIIEEMIDWPCEKKTLYREKNLGCKMAVSSAITWFFENVEEGIILEDDCLPDISFFNYCKVLLEYYREDSRIMMISGDNFQFGKIRGDSTYYFSKMCHIWGWASWKRAWNKYDVKMSNFYEFKNKNIIKKIWKKKWIQKYWINIFEKVYNGYIDTWDYQFVYSIWNNDGLAIIPNKNLVSNIGFGFGATHTQKIDKFSGINTDRITTIIHPSKILREFEADYYFMKNFSLLNKLINKFINLIK